MKAIYDGHHRRLDFGEGDFAWLKLHPYRQLTVARKALTKLSPKFYGPFRVLERIGEVAYHLLLPEESRVHNVFNVSLLKPHHGPPPETITELPSTHDGRTLQTPLSINRLHWFKGRRQLLVQWVAEAPEGATWEDFETFTDAYPDFELEDKLLAEEGSNVTDTFNGKSYHRKCRNIGTENEPRAK